MSLERVCFQLQVKPERIDDYKQRHAAIWPELAQALDEAGWGNYSLFLRPDGQLIGYVEVDDFDRARAAMADTEVNARWQAEMAEFFVDLGDTTPDSGLLRLEEVFHLQDQLRTAPPDLPASSRAKENLP